MTTKKSMSVPKKMKEKYDEITKIIKNFCEEYLNEEYEELCFKMCAALSRKRPSPLSSGKSNSWACGIVHAVGMINFLFDPSKTPHIKAGDLYKAFGVSNSTGLKYSKKVRDAMKLSYFDPDWSLSNVIMEDPFTWLINIDGITLDIREAPSKSERINLAKKALDISPLCSDAYLLLANETTRSLEKSRDIIEMAVKAGEEAIGIKEFEEYKGMFWSVLETRPYMRARIELADNLWNLGEKRKAIDHLKEMLILNPNDNQGVRYILVNWLLNAGDDIELKTLFKNYSDECSANWLYSTALYLFKKGLISKANSKLEEAINENQHVPAFLLGDKEMPDYLPSYYSFGDESEAISYV